MKFVVVDNRHFEKIAVFDEEKAADKWAIEYLENHGCGFLSCIFTEVYPVPQFFTYGAANKSYRLLIPGRPGIYTYSREPDREMLRPCGQKGV